MNNQENIIKALERLAHTTQNNPFAMLNIVASAPRIAVSADEFDQHPYLLNCKNCIVDLNTGQAIAHDPKYLMTKQCNASFKPDAKADIWNDFLSYITEEDQELIDFLARLYGGVGLIGDNPEQVLAIIFGHGKNGKSKMVGAIQHVMGTYSDVLRQEVLMANSSHNVKHDLADLNGARFVVASEPPQGAKINGSVLKELTGGDIIKGRHIYQNSVKFRCVALISVVSNWELEIDAGDEAVKRRLLFIRLNRKIPEEKRDPLLDEKLKAEADGILAWLVRGRMDYLKQGLAVPARIQEETLAYNTDADWFEQFLAQMCSDRPGQKEQADSIYRAYEQYMFGQMQGKAMLGRNKFFSLLARKYGKTHINGLTYYTGLKLTS